jgi:diguanylate cyclase (GGDEF)-like protein/PAS domain S-box-containing protein
VTDVSASHTRANSTAEGGLTALAGRWAVDAVAISQMPFSRDDVERTLRELATDLVTQLTAEPFDPSAGAAAGRRLVVNNFTGSEALGQALSVLGTELLTAAGLPSTKHWQHRLNLLTAALAAGYVDALRDRLFDEQELIKQAVFRARDASERARMASEARFRAVFQSIAVGIAITDLSGQIELVNPALCTILHRPDAELVKERLCALIAEEDREIAMAGFDAVVAGERRQYIKDVGFSDRDGEPVWTRLSISLVKAETGEPTHAVTMVEDISDLHLLRREQLSHSLRDQLTGLPNRTRFISTLESVLRNSEPEQHIALCYLDLDGFKIINDGVGHQVGDNVLRRVAHTLTEEFKNDDATVARVGGDGFAVLITGTTGGFAVTQRIENVLADLAEPVYDDGETGVGVSASVGIVERPAGGVSAEELVRTAEVTVHRAKVNGKAQWELYDEKLDERDRTRFKLGAAISGGLETNEFVLSYQPVGRLVDRSLAALHTVLRWNHPRLGLLGPDEFLGLAEETGFGVHLGRWMLDEVGRQMGDWWDKFGEAMPEIGLSLTPRMARDQDLIQIIRTVIESTGMPVQRLWAGIRSTVAVDDHGEPLENLGFLTDIDVRAVITGYGNGNFGLIDLYALPIAGVSISARVTRAFTSSPAGSPFEQGLRQLVEVADELVIPVIANGVDTVQMSERLQEIGIRLGGGKLMGGPNSADDAAKLIAAGHC